MPSPPWVPLLKYHPELEVPECDEEGQYKTPFVVDEKGCKIRVGRYVSLNLQQEEIKSMVKKHLKKKNLELPNVPIIPELEEEMEALLKKRQELIENRHNAVLANIAHRALELDQGDTTCVGDLSRSKATR
ncbi:hypothetical protein FRC02_002561 [Tulasnella sp. 418]|nr:hypothetical protein FRC02_002561 [Tulasnella sp. 418]